MANEQEGEREQGQPNQSMERSPSSGTVEQPARRTAMRRNERSGERMGPFSLMRRISEDMDRMFDNFLGMSPWESNRPFGFGELTRWPQLEVYRRDNKLIIRADVPGLQKEDVQVEVRDDEICISGERRHETKQQEGDYYRTERSYGSFCRTVPLPEGAQVDTASAQFKNGVLEIEIEIPEQQSKGRKIEVRGESH
jgi:HSP20 family protein